MLRSMIEMVPCRVECHAGYRSEGSPRRFQLQGQGIEIADIVDQWHQGGEDPELVVADFFRVMSSEGQEYLLKHDREQEEWSVSLARRESPLPGFPAQPPASP
jgi:hypothetical protein